MSVSARLYLRTPCNVRGQSKAGKRKRRGNRDLFESTIDLTLFVEQSQEFLAAAAAFRSRFGFGTPGLQQPLNSARVGACRRQCACAHTGVQMSDTCAHSEVSASTHICWHPLARTDCMCVHMQACVQGKKRTHLILIHRRRIMSAIKPCACCFAMESATHRYHLRKGSWILRRHVRTHRSTAPSLRRLWFTVSVRQSSTA
jgi:hypothetical protein